MTTPASSSLDLGTVLHAVGQVLQNVDPPVPLHTPTFAGNEWGYVKECIDTGWVSSAGAYVTRFEEAIQAYTGAKHAVAVVNGTAALHITLRLAGVQADDEVLAPSLTFVATANAINYCQATPHFVEVNEVTLGVCPQRLADYLGANAERRAGTLHNRHTGKRIAALVCMHAFGHPCDMASLLEVCQRYNLPLVEDAAESLGSFYNNQHTGTLGRLGILSFNGNKIISTGGGGAILTNDDELAATARHITTTAKLPHAWAYVHDQVGYNYRLPNLNAALGVAQMEQLPNLVEQKRRIAQRYLDAFADVEGATILAEPTNARSNYWLNALVLDAKCAAAHADLLQAMHDRQWLVRPIWMPMHRLGMYQHCPRAQLSVTESLAARVVNLPSSAHLAQQIGGA
ncbi:LegC family aminotransferase [Phycisphaerales bacterium AB-hyl4]|uniref:LegC family aminotransferase n=1 Tax=Natronomicrosphaera hydrolytica TaxID=3242702 RepID=A0ABV4U9E5_9BACT